MQSSRTSLLKARSLTNSVATSEAHQIAKIGRNLKIFATIYSTTDFSSVKKNFRVLVAL